MPKCRNTIFQGYVANTNNFNRSIQTLLFRTMVLHEKEEFTDEILTAGGVYVLGEKIWGGLIFSSN